jgi:hypothetical protein
VKSFNVNSAAATLRCAGSGDGEWRPELLPPPPHRTGVGRSPEHRTRGSIHRLREGTAVAKGGMRRKPAAERETGSGQTSKNELPGIGPGKLDRDLGNEEGQGEPGCGEFVPTPPD